MAVKHDPESFNVYLHAKYVEEAAHKVTILESCGQDSSYDKARLIRQYQELRESLYKAGWI